MILIMLKRKISYRFEDKLNGKQIFTYSILKIK